MLEFNGILNESKVSAIEYLRNAIDACVYRFKMLHRYQIRCGVDNLGYE